MRALDYKETSRSHGQVDRALESASDDVEGLCHRRFYPQTDTRSFDWPDLNRSRSWRLWLGANELVSVTALTSGGVTIPPSAYFTRRSDNLEEPPYTHIEISLDSSATFGGGVTTQRDIAVTGVFGYTAAERPAGALAGALNSSQTTVDITSAAAVGVGHLIRVEAERMLVTDRAMLDTGQNLAGDLGALASGTTVPVADGAGFNVDEVILIGGERMLIIDIAGNSLVVKRNWDGSVLAAHTTGADIYAPRRLVVERGVLGTAAASHGNGTAIARHTPPGLVRDLCVAEALAQLLQEPAGYARGGGVQDNSRNGISTSNIRSSRAQLGLGVEGLRDRVYTAFGRKARIGAV